MINIFIMMGLYFSTLIITMMNPLSIGVTIMLFTLNMTFIMSMIYSTPWYSYTLFLIFLGGLLILFIYIATLASNTMFKMNSIYLFGLITSLTITILLNSQPSQLYLIHQESNPPILKNIIESIKKYFMINYSNITLYLCIYLLFTLLIVAKIMNVKNGPIRLSH